MSRATARPAEPVVWEEIVSYGETVLKDGKLLVPPKEGSRPGRVKFCSVGSLTLELVQPGEAIRDVNGDFLERVGDGIDHIAFTVDAEHFEQEVEKMKAQGAACPAIRSADEWRRVVYFDTRKAGGIITELMLVPSGS